MRRADEAARSVVEVFGQRVFGWVPGTHLGAAARPGVGDGEWHYWWQAHFLDCLLDASERGSPAVSRALPVRHYRGIWLRNGMRFRNGYFDDMAWLALACQRAGLRRGRLGAELRSAVSDEWGGGAYWHRKRDFKNSAATGPIALYLARSGDLESARALVVWLQTHLRDPHTGLLRDGWRLEGGPQPVLVPHVFTYNQGPALGALLELGDEESLAEAARLVGDVARHLVHAGTSALITHGSGDGGLFTGILTRYLELAARDARLPSSARRQASALVSATAEALWQGRQVRRWRGRPVTVFPGDTGDAPVPHRVELSTQLQAWMALEAAVRIRCLADGLDVEPALDQMRPESGGEPGENVQG